MFYKSVNGSILSAEPEQRITRRQFVLQAGLGTATVIAGPCLVRASVVSGATLDVPSLSREVAQLLETTLHNRLPNSQVKIFGAPVFGVASAQDPLFRKLNEPGVVGPQHLLPSDFLPTARSVICWFTPYSAEVSKSNYGTEDSPKVWTLAHQKAPWPAELVRRFVGKKLKELGANSVVPYQDKQYKVGKTIPCWSSWSERHVAYIAGLGTFGLHKSLITEKGTSGRLDSVVTDLAIPPTPRAYKEIYDNCIKCFRCVGRCPVGSIKETGKDLRLCAKKVLAGKASPDKAVCGKCLTDVSCENCNPSRLVNTK